MKLKTFFALLIGFYMVTIPFSFGEETASNTFPLAYIPQANFHFEPVPEGKEVVHDFIIQNRGESPLVIEKVQTG
jgi:hypothetical protein